MCIALPSAKPSENDPPFPATLRFSPSTVAVASPTHGRSSVPVDDVPSLDPANTQKWPPCHFTIAFTLGLAVHPEVTNGAFSTGASNLICSFVDLTVGRTAAPQLSRSTCCEMQGPPKLWLK